MTSNPSQSDICDLYISQSIQVIELVNCSHHMPNFNVSGSELETRNH